ncbi:MAG: helix-turn-helix transcriptional regulator, partial [Chitinispirillaceae bacterium]|nr:helix-turn-helix transcriptional regulator [Chitinispirillaceae bacterium]
ARMDEIARDAGVTKALIYYYFQGKEAILNELFTAFFREATDFLLNFVERGAFGTNAEENKKMFEAEYESYLESNSDLLKIIFTESLKEEVKIPPLFRLVDLAGNDQDERIEQMKKSAQFKGKEMQQTMVTEFFTGVIPLVVYIMIKKKWCEHFRIGEDELKRYFSCAMQDTHEQYHLKLQSK